MKTKTDEAMNKVWRQFIKYKALDKSLHTFKKIAGIMPISPGPGHSFVSEIRRGFKKVFQVAIT